MRAVEIELKGTEIALVANGNNVASRQEMQIAFKNNPALILDIMTKAIINNKEIENNTLSSIIDNSELVNKIPVQIKTDALRKMLSKGTKVSKVFIACQKIICSILPDLSSCIDFQQNSLYHKHNVYEHLLAVTDICSDGEFDVRLACLLHDIGKPESYTLGIDGHGHFYGHPKISHDICEKALPFYLRLSDKELKMVLDLVLTHDTVITDIEVAVKRVLNKYSIDYIEKWAKIKKADIADHINLRTPLSTYNPDKIVEIAHSIEEKRKEQVEKA